jgi:DNA modification methylase
MVINKNAGTRGLFKDETLFDESYEAELEAKRNAPVTCRGIAFENDKERRKHFTDKLREKLQDPEFRKIEGFPIGRDEDILNLSDPPYYTACPNPWIADFINEWEAQKPTKPEDYHYHREPFAADVSEGKNDPIYSAHSYHTKVPHKAIMRYILHYTEPGDIIFDGFCGTGMTGVAAQMCGDGNEVASLGYKIKADGTILEENTEDGERKNWSPLSKMGARRTLLGDLSPAATYIAHNYNSSVDVAVFERETKRILKEVEKECDWMFETKHSDGRIGKTNYLVWSDVFTCPECANEIVFWDAAVDHERGKVNDEFPCTHCNVQLTKRRLGRAWTTFFDKELNETVKQAKQTPVLINYSVAGKRFEKKPDEGDLALQKRIDSSEIPYPLPIIRMMPGKETRRNDPIGITHVHHFYTRQNLWVIAATLAKLPDLEYAITLLPVIWTNTKLYRYRWAGGFAGAGGGPLAGTLFIPSLIKDISLLKSLAAYLKKGVKKKELLRKMSPQAIMTSSSSAISQLPDASVDYIFTDPPFGANLNYSELNFLWESWLKVSTSYDTEAIENDAHNKGTFEYRSIMASCFSEFYKKLKPGRWMTVEFSNTKASVWNSIQTALTEAGFIVANVSALDKKQGSFKAVTTPTAVKQDLVISAYKPNGGFEERFQTEAQSEEGVWDFIRTHLKYLPVIKHQGALLQFIPERDPRILFDQMVAYYVRKGYQVPVSSQEFQSGLSQRFIERDGMYFLPDQIAEYDRKKMMSGDVLSIEHGELFVKDEASMIEWLRRLLKNKPQTFSDINPLFMQQLGGWSRNESQLDLRELLHQNFLSYDGNEPVPEQIHAYLSSNWKELRNLSKDDPALIAKAQDRWYVPDPNKAGDLEKLREKALFKEFEEYKQAKKKLKIFRLEAVRAGFKKAWQDRDYTTIISVAEKIPNKILEEDPKLLMWYDQAVTRSGSDGE